MQSPWVLSKLRRILDLVSLVNYLCMNLLKLVSNYLIFAWLEYLYFGQIWRIIVKAKQNIRVFYQPNAVWYSLRLDESRSGTPLPRNLVLSKPFMVSKKIVFQVFKRQASNSPLTWKNEVLQKWQNSCSPSRRCKCYTVGIPILKS